MMSGARNAPINKSEQCSTKSRWYSVYTSFTTHQGNLSWALGIVYIMGYVVQQEAGSSSFSVLFLSVIISLLSGLCRYQLPYNCIETRLREANGNASEFAYAWLEFFGQLSLVTLCGRCLTSTIDAIWGEPWHQYIQTNYQPLSMTNLYPDFPTGVVIFLLGIMTSLGLETNRHFRHACFVSSTAIALLLTLLFCTQERVEETFFDVSDLNLLEASAVCCLPLSGALSLKHPDEVRPRCAKKDRRPQVLGFTILAQFLSLGLTTVAFTMYSSTKNPSWSAPMSNLNTHPIVHLLLNLFCVVVSCLVIVDIFSQTWPLLQKLAVNGFVWPVFHKEDSLTQTPVTCIMSVTLLSVCIAVIMPTKALLCSALLPLLLGNIFATLYFIRQSYYPFIATLQEKSHRITLPNSSYQRMDPRPLPDEPDVDQIVLEYLGLSTTGKPNQRPFNVTLVRRLIVALVASQFALAFVVRFISLRPYILAAVAAAFLLVWITCVCWLYRQPHIKQRDTVTFQMPFPPFVTVTASLLNCLLLTHLPASTWLATIIWTVMGVLLYVGYGRRHIRTKARSSINRPVLQLGTCFHPATVRHIHIQPSSPAENLESYPYLPSQHDANSSATYQRF